MLDYQASLGKFSVFELGSLDATFGIQPCAPVIKITWRAMRFPPLGLRSGQGPNPALLHSR